MPKAAALQTMPIAIDDVSWWSIYPPFDCNNATIKVGSVDVLRRTDTTDANTELRISAYMQDQFNAGGSVKEYRFLASMPMIFYKSTSGATTLIATFMV